MISSAPVFFAGESFRATAAFTSALNARASTLPFVDVDRPSRVAFQAGIEEARWVWDPGSPGERELHDLRVRLPGADDSVVRPDRSAHPLPLLGHLGVCFQDQRPHASQGLPAPSTQVADPLVDEPGSWFPGRAWLRCGLGRGGETP